MLNEILRQKNDKIVENLREEIKEKVTNLERSNDVTKKAIRLINGIKNLDKLQLLERMIELAYPVLPSIPSITSILD